MTWRSNERRTGTVVRRTLFPLPFAGGWPTTSVILKPRHGLLASRDDRREQARDEGDDEPRPGDDDEVARRDVHRERVQVVDGRVELPLPPAEEARDAVAQHRAEDHAGDADHEPLHRE